jgi:peptidyl-prolyl cis-trans isomerase C
MTTSSAALRLVRALASQRLVQFVAIGGCIFAIAPPAPPGRDVELRRDAIAGLFVADAQRGASITRDRAGEIEQRLIEDEILYREGLRLGFDREDGVVRQRIIQKVLFMAEELGGASRPPSDDELRAWFEAHPERWARPPRIRFRHVFAHEEADLPPVPVGDAPTGGVASPIGPEMTADLTRIEDKLGAEFARSVDQLAPGTWSAPIRSTFGHHRVRVIEREAARPARFEEVRRSVAEEFSIDRRQEAVATYVKQAFAKYRVAIDGEPVRSIEPLRRIAFRTSASGED